MMRATLSKVRTAAYALALVTLAAFANGCGATKNAPPSDAGAQPSSSESNNNAAAPSTTDVVKLSADIERLEKAAERNPGDEDMRDELASAYVRRGDAERASGQPQEALKDYQRALRLDPNNDEAQKNAADTERQLGGGEQEDENGAPLPPPITPNVAEDDDKPSAHANEKPTATPKKQ
ncbi:MAG: tetratricopeptide repeat protein [Pyrinomonadaceae bacterium]